MHLAATITPVETHEHPVRTRLNAWLFRVLDGYFAHKYARVKRDLFGGLPRTVLEIGSGAGANFRYLDPGTRVVALEPNVHMHPALHAAAIRSGVTVDVRAARAERIPLPDGSFDAVISSLVLCSVDDPERALAEVRRVLRPGGRFWCLEHVAAPGGTVVAGVQDLVRRPWRWLFQGCDTRRDTERLLREAGFAEVEVSSFTVRTALLPIRAHIAAVALR
jgi:ubiquinone/menaquinone biosynthesis C-methylase UbiE